MMNRIIFNVILRAARVNPTIRSAAPFRRWESSKASAGGQSQTSPYVAGAVGGIAVLLGGFAWYHFSGTRQTVNTTQGALNTAEELKNKVKDAADGSSDSATNTISYLRSATAKLIPDAGPVVGKIFDQMEQISKEHGDDVKKIFDETYKDFEKLSKEGGLDAQTTGKAVDILQKRVKELQDLAGDAYDKFMSENPKIKDKISDNYNKLKEVVEKTKGKKPEVEKLLKDTSSELVKIFKDNVATDKAVKQAQELLKKKVEEVKKIGEDVAKPAKKLN